MKVATIRKTEKEDMKFEVERIACVNRNKRGQIEFVLAYKDKIPGPEEEPGLYKGAEPKRKGVETHLTYPDNVLIILTNVDADNEFRRAHPDIIKRYETAKIGESPEPRTLSTDKIYPGDKVYVITPYNKPLTWIEGTVSSIKKPKIIPLALQKTEFLKDSETAPFTYISNETEEEFLVMKGDAIIVEIPKKDKFGRKKGLFEVKMK